MASAPGRGGGRGDRACRPDERDSGLSAHASRLSGARTGLGRSASRRSVCESLIRAVCYRIRIHIIDTHVRSADHMHTAADCDSAPHIRLRFASAVPRRFD